MSRKLSICMLSSLIFLACLVYAQKDDETTLNSEEAVANEAEGGNVDTEKPEIGESNKELKRSSKNAEPALDKLNNLEKTKESEIIDVPEMESQSVKEEAVENKPIEEAVEKAEPVKEEVAEEKVEEPVEEKASVKEEAVEDKPIEEAVEKAEPVKEEVVEEKMEEPVEEKASVKEEAVEEPSVTEKVEAVKEAVEEVKTEEVAQQEKTEETSEKVEEAKPEESPKENQDAPEIEKAVADEVKEGIEKTPNLADVKVDPRKVEISTAMAQEAIRRKAYEQHAEQTLKSADVAMENRNYEQAAKLYEEARQFSGVRVETEGMRKRIQKGMALSNYGLANQYWKDRDFAKAKTCAQNAIRYGHPDGRKLLSNIEKDQVKTPEHKPQPKPASVRRTPEYKAMATEISDLYKKGKEYFQTGEYDKSKEQFERILKRDPYHTEAIKMLEKVARRRQDIKMMELQTTRDSMVADVKEAWNPRSYGVNEDRDKKSDSSSQIVREKKGDPNRERIMRKLENIKIPEIDFRSANIHAVTTFLGDQSKIFDTTGDEKKGVDIILNLSGFNSPAAAPVAAEAPADDFAGGSEPAASANPSEIPPITFKATYISLLEALKLVCDVSGVLTWRIEGSVIMVVHRNTPERDLVQRMYDVLPSANERIASLTTDLSADTSNAEGLPVEGNDLKATGVATPGTGGDWKAASKKLGVHWPIGSSIIYLQGVSKLVVKNTPDNLAEFEKVLDILNVVPNQVEIETRFIEVLQTDLDSFGLEWLLTDDWELAQNKNQANLPLSSRQMIKVKGGSSDRLTKGNRYLENASATAIGSVKDDIFTVASYLTNPQLELVLHMLQQKGNTDLLSAPKVVTKSAQSATIKVVTEYIYPTEFEVTPVTSTGTADAGSQIMGGIVQPGGFQTREVGVLLEVVPEVSQEGNMINLTMTPQVVEEPIWKDYGSTYMNPDGTEVHLPMEQPFFKLRTITTSLSIYNGATVVMGGMIVDKRNDVDDKVPFLGDIPVFGRLFRSRYNHSEKRNLLIFVTAKLVDPAGRPVQNVEKIMDRIGGNTTATTTSNTLSTAITP